MARILAISSHVVRGHVGLAATVPALQSLGHEVWALPTVLLASRPGLGRLQPIRAAGARTRRHAGGAGGRRLLADARCGVHGLFPVAGIGAAWRPRPSRASRRPTRHLLVCVDPILGDAGRLYVAQETAEAIRDRLIPLADVATPNLFELTWLTGLRCRKRRLRSCRSACKLGPPTVASLRRRTAMPASARCWSCAASSRSIRAARAAPFRTAPATCWPGCSSAACCEHEPAEAALARQPDQPGPGSRRQRRPARTRPFRPRARARHDANRPTCATG